MRNGVHSSKKIISVVLQLVFGIFLGHACFTFYDIINCDNIKTNSNDYDSSMDHVSINSTFSSEASSNDLEAKAEFLDGEGIEEETVTPEKKFSNGINESNDAIYNGNVRSLSKSKGLLLVGVMTSNRFLKTRACTVYNTWAKHIQGTVIFYAEEEEELVQVDDKDPSASEQKMFDDCAIPLVRLRGVTNAYPPQKKSFLMLRHMAVHYSKRYRWFLRADDDVFINFNTIHSFLQSIYTENNEKLFYIGQEGTGKSGSNEILGLDINNGQNYCMGGPGVIFNSRALLKLKKHIKSCLKSLQTNHEDVEIGRCAFKKLNLSCTNNLEMKELFHHFYPHDVCSMSPGSLDCSFTLFSKSITLHPLKSSRDMLRIYKFALKHQRHVQNYKITEVLSDIDKIKENIDSNSGDRSLTSDIILNNVALWDTYSHDKKYGDYYSGQVTTKNFPSRWKTALGYLTGLIELDLNKESYEKGRKIKYRGFNYGYGTQMERHKGTNYVLDLYLNHIQLKNQKQTKVRKHVYLEQRYLPLRIHPKIKNLSQIKDAVLNVILPLYQKTTRFETFLVNYERNFLNDHSKTAYNTMRLVVIVFSPSQSDKIFVQDVATKLKSLKDKYPTSFKYTMSKPLHEAFSRAKGLDYGAKFVCKNPNELMFFVDVDIFFNLEAVNTIRFLVLQGKTVYFPIVYSTFGSSKFQTDINLDNNQNNGDFRWRNISHFEDIQGYWRQFGYGMVAMYRSDYIGMDLSIHGWGKEDVTLYDQFLRTKPHLELIRSADPDIIHLYHPVQCDPNLPTDQLQMCYASSYSNYRSTVDAALEIEQLNITRW